MSVAPRALVWIGFASQTGTAGQTARRIMEELSNSDQIAQCCDIRLFCLNRYEEFLHELEGTQHVYAVFVAASFGKGEAPINGKKFEAMIKGNAKIKALEKIKFAVIGFGNSMFPAFCGFSKMIDAEMKDIGAKRLVSRLDADGVNVKR
jgi:sulfite reductase (NADPH) flavoprotein alpha-component